MEDEIRRFEILLGSLNMKRQPDDREAFKCNVWSQISSWFEIFAHFHGHLLGGEVDSPPEVWDGSVEFLRHRPDEDGDGFARVHASYLSRLPPFWSKKLWDCGEKLCYQVRWHRRIWQIIYLLIYSGFGKTSYRGEFSDKLLFIFNKIVASYDCESRISTDSTMFCGRSPKGKQRQDACKGDSGGSHVY